MSKEEIIKLKLFFDSTISDINALKRFIKEDNSDIIDKKQVETFLDDLLCSVNETITDINILKD